DVYIQLRNEKSGKKIKKAVTIRIRHDVWKGRFYADLQDSSYVFEHFDRLKQFFHSLYFDISPAGALDRNAPFVLTTWAEVAAISKVQNDRLKDWIMNADETEEMHASDKRNPGFRFSISRLIGSMVGSKKNPDNMTPRYQTDQFTINGLR
ncbi:hypothetical protein JW935_27635, partial [candidate division KSB1 bacterium]|nr:hypothetical protein [candidate division KSB1 bacterium]